MLEKDHVEEVSMTATKEISIDAVIAAVLPELGGIFTLEEE